MSNDNNIKCQQKHLGAQGELKAAAYFLDQGYDVFRNVSQFGHADLVLRDPVTGKLIAVDVKSSTFKARLQNKPNVKFAVPSKNGWVIIEIDVKLLSDVMELWHKLFGYRKIASGRVIEILESRVYRRNRIVVDSLRKQLQDAIGCYVDARYLSLWLDRHKNVIICGKYFEKVNTRSGPLYWRLVLQETQQNQSVIEEALKRFEQSRNK